MTGAPPPAPPGGVDLAACDREPIHVPGAVQPFGVLVAVSPDWIVSHVSGNAADLFGADAEDLLGTPLHDLLTPQALHEVRGRVQALHGPDASERLFDLPLTASGACFDAAVHLSEGTIVIEAEPSIEERAGDGGALVRAMVGRLRGLPEDPAFFREAARQMQAVLGFDRVMVYRFDHEGAGEVVAEVARGGIESYLGLHYPASDIPSQARRLYERNWLRLIADVDGAAVPVLPETAPDGRPLDLSLSTLRAVSPIHLDYLRNMGVAASLSVSILRGGRLWGLFACHHMAPRRVSLRRRTTAELLGQMFSLLLESREREADLAREARAREVHGRLMMKVAADASSFDNLSAFLDEVGGIVASDGVGLWIDGRTSLRGSTPTEEEFLGLVRFLNRAPMSRIYATGEIGRVFAPARAYVDRAAGLLAVPISRFPRDYLVFFRQERVRSVAWAGDPAKPVRPGADGLRLTPRRSFAAWRETVRGQSLPWTRADLHLAESLRVSLLEIVLRLTNAAARERKEAHERQELLVAELNHRVRNILTLVRGIVGQTRAEAATVDAFKAALDARIQALARAHDQITDGGQGRAPLRRLVLTEAGAYLGPKADCLTASGPNVLLERQAFTTLALVVHELVTNSAKYGALSDSRGRAAVEWRVTDSGALAIDWRERGGPAVQAPKRRGFGTTLIERAVPFDLRGEAELRWRLTGLEARFVVPERHFRLGGAGDEGATLQDDANGAPPAPRAQAPLDGTVLLVEDNMIIALDAEDEILRLGASRVEVAPDVVGALRFLDAERPGFAVLDLNLGIETSLPVAERLHEMGVPFLFATGYGDKADLPVAYKDTPIVRKPYAAADLRRHLPGAEG
ncbi:MAG: GAF domain-containing protein [Geminicoccaceae bacterium]|nr:GAF domain-containing protein [Geminicoccaceae bacterium]